MTAPRARKAATGALVAVCTLLQPGLLLPLAVAIGYAASAGFCDDPKENR